VDVDGDRWYLDEYGDTSSEFTYMASYLWNAVIYK
jgi:hypothetical protein